MRTNKNINPIMIQKELPICLTEFFEDHMFGSDILIDEQEEREHLESEFIEETSTHDDFDDWFQNLAENGGRFAKW